MLGKRFAKFRRNKEPENSESLDVDSLKASHYFRVLPEPKHGFNEVFAPADTKVKMTRERYEQILQRVKRSDKFSQAQFGPRNAPANTSDDIATRIFSSENRLTLSSTLRGRPPGRFLVFGMLSSMADGKLYLEDLDTQIELVIDSDSQVCSPGFFPENSFVLVDALYTVDRTLLIKKLQCPPIEYATKSKRYLQSNAHSTIQTFSLDLASLQTLEQKNEDASFVILSDVWLDQPQVLKRLGVMFEGFSRPDAVAPTAFLLLGNFSSSPYVYNSAASKIYREGWDKLADTIAEFPKLIQSSKFIFIPGPGDPALSGGGAGLGGGYCADNNASAKDRYGIASCGIRSAFGSEETAALPQSHIPYFFTGAKLQRLLGDNLVSAPNPCRIAYCSQEIVIFRQDTFSKILKSSLFKPNDSFTEHTHLFHSILSQAHLSPLPLAANPIYWGLDASLRLNPLPDVLILADRLEAYSNTYANVKIINPGVLPLSDFTFLVYYPCRKQVELSHIPQN